MILGRRNGLMVSALLGSGSSGPGSSPDQGHCVAEKTLSLTVPLSAIRRINGKQLMLS